MWKCLNSWVAAAMVLLINIPLAALGSVVALLLLNRPEHGVLDGAAWWQWPKLWAGATTLSVAHWVGFITLIGIVSRNGIMMLAHYIHLMKEEGEAFGDAMIVRGTIERLAPVLMTALTAIIGLIPLALGAGQTGKEILHPLAIVVIGGLIDATILDQIVTPAAFKLFGKYVYRKPGPNAATVSTAVWNDVWLHEQPVDAIVPQTQIPIELVAVIPPAAPINADSVALPAP